jgi:peptidoglycan/LPS O-acetylase OafA/YrhL
MTGTMSRPGIAHQPALDGLRAVSVLVVLLFHGQITGFTGGYLGVSVFFTLSGYLITSLLIAERTGTGNTGVGAFYVRRAKRLLPASLLCLTAIAVAAAVTDWFDAVTTLRRDLLGALLQVANWVSLSGSGSYQQLFSESAGQLSPVEHYWSLAIEEQFYWVWPLAFVGLCRVARTHAARTWIIGIATAGFALLAPVITIVWGADAGYWATPARAAEILVGALVAFLLWGRTAPRWWSAVAIVAFAVLAVAVVTFPAAGGPAYHGALPLVGLVSALLVAGLQAPGLLRTALGTRPLVWLGQISYGVYLFHWPVFVVLDQQRLDLPLPALFAVRMAITLVIAQLSFMLVERPIRRGISWRPHAIGVAALAGCVAVAAVAVVLVPGGDADYWRRSGASTP